MRLRELRNTGSDLTLLRRFYEGVYCPEFPDPDEREALVNVEEYLRLKDTGWYAENAYHVVVAEASGAILGGAIADYLAEPNAGVLEFLVVAPAARSRGLGRRLLGQMEALLAADARRAGREGLEYIVAEINDPFRTDLDADSIDPFVRARIWGEWGYRRLDLNYVQPALSAEQRPVGHLMLACKPLTAALADGLPVSSLLATLREYLRWAMRIPVPEVNPGYQAMAAELADREVVPSIPLGAYVGHDPAASLSIQEIDDDDDDLAASLAVYTGTFRAGATVLDPDAFRQALAGRGDLPADCHYHYWVVRESPEAPIGGMVSFYTLPRIGFGGYMAFGPRLRGRGRARLVVARIEEQMRRDNTGALGWLVECEPGSAALAVVTRLGFRELALDYRQPALPGRGGETPRLALAYKDFGAQRAAPALDRDALQVALLNVFRVVYGLESPEQQPLFLDLVAQLQAWPRHSAAVR